MLAVLKATSPQGETTRLVFGCAEPAQMTGQALYECGFQVEADMVEEAPVRGDEEKVRAEHILKLVFESAVGHA